MLTHNLPLFVSLIIFGPVAVLVAYFDVRFRLAMRHFPARLEGFPAAYEAAANYCREQIDSSDVRFALEDARDQFTDAIAESDEGLRREAVRSLRGAYEELLEARALSRKVASERKAAGLLEGMTPQSTYRPVAVDEGGV